MMKKYQTKIVAVLVVCIGLILSLVLLEKLHIIDIINTKGESSTIKSDTPLDAPKASQSSNPNTTDKDPQATTIHNQNLDKNATNSSATSELVAPSGSFVSDHTISLSGVGGGKLESICITTVGATCGITFQKDAVIKSLELKKTNSSGSVAWYWNPRDAGLTPGSWKITATSHLGTTTKATNDLENLEVSP